MRFLFLNWRDRKHPASGGAERVTEDICRRLVDRGHEVYLFCAKYPGGKGEEVVNGVRIIRRGGKLSVRVSAFFNYWNKFRGQVDMIVDQFHGLPFFSCLYAREKQKIIIFEIAGDIWQKTLPFPWGQLGSHLESLALKICRREYFLTSSKTTKDELMKSGIQKDHIKIVPLGSPGKPRLILESRKAEVKIIYIGRLCPMKQVDDLIKALKIVRRQREGVGLWVVGGGEEAYISRLKEDVALHGLEGAVVFFGKVSEKYKRDLLRRSAVLVSASMREGWGLVVNEANLQGIPVVVYNSPGFRDSVKPGVNGLLCQNNSPAGLAKNILRLLDNEALYSRLRRGGFLVSQKNTWENSMDNFERILTKSF